jgi:ABC-type phosphate transport system substrate-binding protein
MSTLPNAPSAQVRSRPFDLSANDLHAGGATFPALAYNGASQPVGLFSATQAPPAAGSLFATIKFSNGANIYYCLTGSGTGVGIFTSGLKGQSNGTTATTTAACAPLGATPTGFGARVDPPDFAASDAALASTDYTAYKAKREPGSGTSWGEPFEAPVIGGPIVYAYRPITGFPKIAGRVHLSKWAYCAIANGTISNWNDAALTKDNAASVTGGVSEPITFVFRSDGSGTTYNYTYHLNSACKGPWPAPYNAAPYETSGHSANWAYGFNKNWPGPGSTGVPNAHFIGESGNPGVLAQIQSAHFSVGYVEGAYAASANPAVAQSILQSSASGGSPVWSDPTIKPNLTNALSILSAASITHGGGSDGLPLGTSRPTCVLYIDPSKFTNPVASGAPATSYPINAISYLLFYGKNNGVHTAQKLQLAIFMTGVKARNLESKLEYTPLPSSITTAVASAANGTSSQAACIK